MSTRTRTSRTRRSSPQSSSTRLRSGCESRSRMRWRRRRSATPRSGRTSNVVLLISRNKTSNGSESAPRPWSSWTVNPARCSPASAKPGGRWRSSGSRNCSSSRQSVSAWRRRPRRQRRAWRSWRPRRGEQRWRLSRSRRFVMTHLRRERCRSRLWRTNLRRGNSGWSSSRWRTRRSPRPWPSVPHASGSWMLRSTSSSASSPKPKRPPGRPRPPRPPPRRKPSK
mmetsp:Transcript_23223/g.56508  ORF Transcript_23223/g.56508 Transcript_23223/m.56508 type:complete len:225 (-) Transcript_23223:686-1360(-)